MALNFIALMQVVKKLSSIPPGSIIVEPGGFSKGPEWTQLELKMPTPVAEQFLSVLREAGVDLEPLLLQRTSEADPKA